MMRESMEERVASVVFAAGKGSRMVGYEGNKTLLPLIPRESILEGERPLLIEVLENLPPGSKGIVVNHREEDVKKATKGMGVSYMLKPATNGTGGALLAARRFIESAREGTVVVTMGDVPLIRPGTYREIVSALSGCDIVVLGFTPRERAQYGMIEMSGDQVIRIVEWKYWHKYPPERQRALKYCNAGVYGVRRGLLLSYLDRLAATPHEVTKQRGESWVTIEEYFLTDLVELMSTDGLSARVVMAAEEEVTGVDTPQSLERVQEYYSKISTRKG